MNNNSSDGLKNITVSSIMTYLIGMPAEKLEKIIMWGKLSKNPSANINTITPSDWEKNLKKMFSQLTPQDQAEVISRATKLLNEKKSR